MSESDDTAMLKAIATKPLRAFRFPPDDDEGEFEHVFMEWLTDNGGAAYDLTIEADEIVLLKFVDCKIARTMTWRRVR